MQLPENRFDRVKVNGRSASQIRTRNDNSYYSIYNEAVLLRRRPLPY
jgi:hypothetical protein